MTTPSLAKAQKHYSMAILVVALAALGVIIWAFVLIRSQGHEISDQNKTIIRLSHTLSREVTNNAAANTASREQLVAAQKRRDRITAQEFQKLFIALTTGVPQDFTIKEAPVAQPTKTPQGPTKVVVHHHKTVVNHHKKEVVIKPTPTAGPCVGIQGTVKCLLFPPKK